MAENEKRPSEPRNVKVSLRLRWALGGVKTVSVAHPRLHVLRANLQLRCVNIVAFPSAKV
jgi:hypothetical protein